MHYRDGQRKNGVLYIYMYIGYTELSLKFTKAYGGGVVLHHMKAFYPQPHQRDL